MKNITAKKIKEIEDFAEFLDNGYIFQNCCFQNIDFTDVQIKWNSLRLIRCIFLGCTLGEKDLLALNKTNSLIFPEVHGLPYEVYRNKLYSWQELYQKDDKHQAITYDEKIYQHFYTHRYADNISEALCQRIHDHSIDDALYDLLGLRKDGSYRKKAIAIMGGHGTLRSDPYYKKVVKISFQLARAGYLIASGGGPGIMEAANLGAYLANYTENEVDEVLEYIHSDLKYSDLGYLEVARAIIKNVPMGNQNLAIPTWFYGHEPSNLFATHIAKYFSNSIREDTLLAIALHGILFAPGSAGTNQEIFMDLAQNHYATFGYYSPMVFLGVEHYGNSGVYNVVKNFSRGTPYDALILLENDINQIVDFLIHHPPIAKQEK